MFIVRVVFMELLLGDVFDETDLICDTEQVGCERTCQNRFDTMTFKKLWEAEFYLCAVVTSIFVVFELTQRKYLKVVKRKYAKGKIKSTKSFTSAINLKTVTKSGEKVETQIQYSSIISAGYIAMLVIRLAIECWFVKVEYNLGVHQSGNVGFYAFSLPERFDCLTNNKLSYYEIGARNVSNLFFNNG